MKEIIAIAVALGIGLGTIVALWVNYEYNWTRQCAALGGVKMHDTSDDDICVKGPVQIVTVAARAW